VVKKFSLLCCVLAWRCAQGADADTGPLAYLAWVPYTAGNAYAYFMPVGSAEAANTTNWNATKPAQGSYTASTNWETGWSCVNVRITGGFNYRSAPYCFILNDANDGTGNGVSWVSSPLMTNGVGRLVFYLKNKNAVTYWSWFAVEGSTDFATWTNIAHYSNTLNGSWAGYTTTVNSSVAQYIRVLKTNDNASGVYTMVDDLEVTSWKP
jgi:hypothetical protein